jgi:hypothetical protein
MESTYLSIRGKHYSMTLEVGSEAVIDAEGAPTEALVRDEVRTWIAQC